MESTIKPTDNLIARAYEKYYSVVLAYLSYRIVHRYEAEDLTQDVFERLLGYGQMLRPDTLKQFIYTVTRNVLTDYLRRYYKKQEIDSYLYDTTPVGSNETEEQVIGNDLMEAERRRILQMPEQRRKIYTLHRFEEKPAEEIAAMMCLSRRTVDNHLFLGRREMRAYFRKCI